MGWGCCERHVAPEGGTWCPGGSHASHAACPPAGLRSSLPSRLLLFSGFLLPLGPAGLRGTDASPSEPKAGSFSQPHFPGVMETLPARTAHPCALSWPPNTSTFQGALVLTAARRFSHGLGVFIWFHPGATPATLFPNCVLSPSSSGDSSTHAQRAATVSPSPWEWAFLSQIPVC